MRKIYIIGIGMGNPEIITVAGQKAIAESRGLAGAKRMVDSFSTDDKAKCDTVVPEEILRWIEENEELDPVSVLMSGDVGFFSGAEKIRTLLADKYNVKLIPGISSLQYFCAKLAITWEDVKAISLHGRESNFVGEVQTSSKVFILTDPVSTPEYICKGLLESGLEHVIVHVGQKLSYPEERIESGLPDKILEHVFDDINVVLIENPKPILRKNMSSGLEDATFIRGDVPMTKSEIRSMVMSKLQICEDDVLYDIGGGTGSVSVEMAMLAAKGQVHAIECNEEAIDLIKKNKEKFGVTNLHIIYGTAPDAMADLPTPCKAFIGGTKGNMEPVLAELIKRNGDIRIVINVVTLESLFDAMNGLKNSGYELIDIIHVSVNKANERGNYHLMTAENPIFVLTAKGGSPL